MKWTAPLLFVLIFLSNGFPGTITVDLHSGGDYTEIQSSIDATKDRDTVLVRPGGCLIKEPIIFLGKAITVMAESTSSFGKSRN